MERFKHFVLRVPLDGRTLLGHGTNFVTRTKLCFVLRMSPSTRSLANTNSPLYGPILILSRTVDKRPAAGPLVRPGPFLRNIVPLEAVTCLEPTPSPRFHPGPDLYYYEVIECGRRMLLTGVLIFIAPNTSAQTAMACIFAFASLLAFELLHPYLDPMDSWLYRLVRSWLVGLRAIRSYLCTT